MGAISAAPSVENLRTGKCSFETKNAVRDLYRRRSNDALGEWHPSSRTYATWRAAVARQSTVPEPSFAKRAGAAEPEAPAEGPASLKMSYRVAAESPRWFKLNLGRIYPRSQGRTLADD